MFTPKRHVIQRMFLLTLVCIFLPGFYATDYEVLRTGDRIPLAGKYVCRVITGTFQRMNLQKTSSSLFTSSYEYHDFEDGSTVRFKKLENNFFLSQVLSKTKGQLIAGAKYQFLYHHFNAPGKISIYAPLALFAGKKSVEQRTIFSSAQRNGVELKAVHPTTAKLHGSSKNTETFLSQHIAEMLTKIADCIHE